jgi:hypothetical protein
VNIGEASAIAEIEFIKQTSNQWQIGFRNHGFHGSTRSAWETGQGS